MTSSAFPFLDGRTAPDGPILRAPRGRRRDPWRDRHVLRRALRRSLTTLTRDGAGR